MALPVFACHCYSNWSISQGLWVRKFPEISIGKFVKIFRHIFIAIMVVLFIQVWRSAIVPCWLAGRERWSWKCGDRGKRCIIIKPAQREALRRLATLYKGKGPRTLCSNYRPVTLMSMPGKVFTHVLLARIQPLIDQSRRSQQSGFTTGTLNIDAVLALRLLSELHCKFNRWLNVVYLDIKSAFKSINRNALWKALCYTDHCPSRKYRFTYQGLTETVTENGHHIWCQTSLHSSSLKSFSESASHLGLNVSWPETDLQNIGSSPKPTDIVNKISSCSTNQGGS